MIESSNFTMIKILIDLKDKSMEKIVIKKSLGESEWTWVKATIKAQIWCYYSFKEKILLKTKQLIHPMVKENVSIHNSGNLKVMNQGKANML